MTHDDFVCHFLQLADTDCLAETKSLLARVADTTNNGSGAISTLLYSSTHSCLPLPLSLSSLSPYRLISLSEFRAFESLLTSPDSISQLAFRLFDTDNRGRVTFGEPMTAGTVLHPVTQSSLSLQLIFAPFSHPRPSTRPPHSTSIPLSYLSILDRRESVLWTTLSSLNYCRLG